MDEIFELTDMEQEILTRLEKRIPYREVIFGDITNYNLIMEDYKFKKHRSISCLPILRLFK